MAKVKSWHLWGGFWATSLGTLASRVLGLVRDVATASLLGLGEGGVMDAFVVAFRIPNLLRRMFGEGALAASFLPVFSAEYQKQPRAAWQLATAVFVWLGIVLTLLVLIGEIVLGLLWWWGYGEHALVSLLAVMLPYMALICLAAQASAALQALMNFRIPAIAPTLLNVCWLAAAWWVAPHFEPDKLAQAHVIAVAVLVSGVLQLGIQLPALRQLGFHFEYRWRESRDAFWRVLKSMAPITLGMAVTQINTLLDSFIAWGLAAPASGTASIWWLGDAVDYPMQSGAAAAIYYGERFYQLPVGVVGVAIATVVFPLLSKHAARGDLAQLGQDLTVALRLVWFIALPAGVGMILTAEPLVRVLFERGAFTGDDAVRAARMIAGYATGVWAYTAIPVLVRGFYSTGDRITPARVAMIAVGVNLVLNLTLIWPLAELGLAAATSIAAALQVFLLVRLLARRYQFEWAELRTVVAKIAIAVILMALVVTATQYLITAGEDANRTELAVSVSLAIGAGVATYLLAAWLLGMGELRMLLMRPTRDDPSQLTR